MAVLLLWGGAGFATPVPKAPASTSPLSTQAPQNLPVGLKGLRPVDPRRCHLDLWNLEGKAFVRSPVILSPDQRRMAYTEVVFRAAARQTTSALFVVDVPPVPTPPIVTDPGEPTPSVYDPRFEAQRFDTNGLMRARRKLLAVGENQVKPFAFETLTIVDWSANGRRLLVEQRSGRLHTGLQPSRIWWVDVDKGVSTLLWELTEAPIHLASTLGRTLPPYESMRWMVEPLGWEPASDTLIWVRAWQKDAPSGVVRPLGLWQVNLDARRPMLKSRTALDAPVAANGWVLPEIKAAETTPEEPKPSRWANIKRKLESKFSKED